MQIEELNSLKDSFEQYLRRTTKLSDKTIKSKISTIEHFIMSIAIKEALKGGSDE